MLREAGFVPVPAGERGAARRSRRPLGRALLAFAWPAAIGLLSGLLLLLVALPIAGLLFAASPRELSQGSPTRWSFPRFA